MGQECELFIIDVRNADSSLSSADAILRIPMNKDKITSMLWGSLDETMITGHSNGQISMWDLRVSTLKFYCYADLLLCFFFFFQIPNIILSYY